MQQQPAEHPDLTRVPALSWTELARHYAVLSAEYGALLAARDADRQQIQRLFGGRCGRFLHFCRQAVRMLLPRGTGRVRLARAGWRLLGSRWRLFSREPLASARPALARGSRPNVFVGHGATPRVLYIGDRGPYEAASMRYRAHNLIEALALRDTRATFIAEDDLAEVMAHDIIVLVRRRWNPRIKALIEAARQAEIPLVFDLDDFLFDPWVLPYIDSARGPLCQWTVQYIKDFRATLASCDFFTTPTQFLLEQAALWNKPGWVIRNGLNATQLAQCRTLLHRPRPTAADGSVRIGYFCGTKTHQADFRAAYPALVRVLQECAQVRLVIVGELDLQEFPGLGPFAAQIEQLPCVDWRELPALISTVDINVVPLEINPYTQGKSDLKYFEAGILKVPTIASPTEVFARAIRHGETGWLAASDEDWYRALKLLASDAALRSRLCENAHAHALRDYVPAAVAVEALSAYEQILRAHRDRRDVAA